MVERRPAGNHMGSGVPRQGCYLNSDTSTAGTDGPATCRPTQPVPEASRGRGGAASGAVAANARSEQQSLQGVVIRGLEVCLRAQ